MQEKAMEVLNIIESKGYEAYIVGGYVRDFLLGEKSIDIDICTNAKPKEIVKLFDMVVLSEAQYGSVQILYKNTKFDITTYRKEIKYELNRKPIKIKYIDDIKKDLLRRDFTINTLCMNKDGKVLDVLAIENDLQNRIIKTVGNPRYRIKEDSLRILRAIRFACILNFTIDDKTKYYLKKYGYLLKKLSFNRKKDELNKIFSSPNKSIGRDLLIKLKLNEYLMFPNLEKIVLCDDIIGIWSQLNVDDIYPFTKIEKHQMEKIREILAMDIINNYTVYKYDLYLVTVAADIKQISKTKINNMYKKLPIRSQNEIAITPLQISEILNKKPGKYLKEIYTDIEQKIVNRNLNNNFIEIKQYILKQYGD